MEKSENLHGEPFLITFCKNGFQRKDTVKHLGLGLLGRFYFYLIDSAINIKNKKTWYILMALKTLENEIYF